ncbi:hypothetical protein COV81_05165 [Candidatus Peregrinibacteria bacterium CG11_big_fil_rev_8_21_14_0_20_41_10]|nr:MAG: hypothetical protein COV81_05165 [Candidatus Peregrinibacteria bacterium CG11_big_fil_rev_8_21_14_0_20_41_10]PIZ76908.1 MAG: hypothetical protein COY06_01160 [Candidatus Peregrinibacteria bacterium CG_4_10_14_0_2_um_filter_41_8]PJC37814.1 MAG: hypothetical protein CO045_03540 [Candidatus Peregrinibacteria bacterium CG_4_9_14_0_2_um_filter_41_14]
MSVKQILSYVGVFLLGGALTLVAFNGGSLTNDNGQGSLELRKPTPTSAERDQLAIDRGEKRGPNIKPTQELKQYTPDKLVKGVKAVPDNNMCTYNTCDLMARLNEVHNQIGVSTWSVSSMLVNINHNVNALYQQFQYGSNSLSRQIQDLHDEVGYSSWTLQTLAQQIANVCRP